MVTCKRSNLKCIIRNSSKINIRQLLQNRNSLRTLYSKLSYVIRRILQLGSLSIVRNTPVPVFFHIGSITGGSPARRSSTSRRRWTSSVPRSFTPSRTRSSALPWTRRSRRVLRRRPRRPQTPTRPCSTSSRRPWDIHIYISVHSSYH